jgi:cytochrome c oxidase assembly factor CtaG
MSIAIKTAADSCAFPVPVTLALLIIACVYLRGWLHFRKAFPQMISLAQFAAFMSGLSALWIAIASPVKALDHELLTFHMVQHLVLMAVAPPLILQGAPFLPLLHGLPRSFVRVSLGPLFRHPAAQWVGRVATHPVFCLFAASFAVIAWHYPPLFELGLHSHRWHEVEHACFLTTGLLFWWPVVQPWPSVARWPRWSTPLYLFVATLPCDALSAFLAFCDRVVYGAYAAAPHLAGVSPLGDQEFAGALMWVSVTFIYLTPAVVITIQLLSPSRLHTSEQDRPDWQRRPAAEPLRASRIEVP